MPKYVIERDLPGAGRLSGDELRSISQKSCNVISNLDKRIQWLQSYVTDDRIYCLYDAPDAEAILEHARRGGFPANRISEVKSEISPATAVG